MLTGVDPPLNGAVVLLEHVVQIWHRPMPAILGESAFGFELRDGGRIRVAVGVDHPRRGMSSLRPALFARKRLAADASCLAERRKGGAGGIHRPIKVTPLAFHPDVRLVHAPAVIGGLQVAA
jgi:hypothetical protein